jgi:predicted AlkP superfamily pyrophosphatase or phosphodiesterase
MKKIIVIAAALLVFLTGGAFAQGPAVVKHVIVISVDGFRPDFYLDSSWQAVRIRELMAGGTYTKGENSVFPSMTYPSHTTMVTGVQPAVHGIYYNTGPGEKVYWNDSSIKSPTLWAAAEQKGMVVASLLWPVSADAPVQYDIPDIGSLGQTVQDQYSKPAGFVDALKKDVFGGASRIDYGVNTNVGKIAAYVIGQARPNLMTIHLFSVDHFEHEQGRDGDKVRAAVRSADSAVGIIVDAVHAAGIADSTVVIVTGDHGFVTITQQVNPNVWLAKAGLLTDVKKGDWNAGNWKAQFYSVGGSSYLYLKDRSDVATLDAVKKILRELPDSVRQYFRVIDRKKMNEIGGNPEVEFALSGLKGTAFGNVSAGEAVTPAHGGQHGHFPDFYEIRTGFVIYGPGVRKGGVIKEMNERDTAPTVARLLGLDFPSAVGKAPGEIFVK